MRKAFVALAVAVGLGVPTAGIAPVLAASTATPYCGITWGSTLKSASGMTTAPLTNVRGGQNTCYDRLVLDLAGPAAGYNVRYVDQVIADGSGQVVPVRGGARLQVTVFAPAYDVNTGAATYRPANRSELVAVTGWQTFRQVAWAGSFEGYTDLGLGVRARLPFRVFVLAGPGSASRLVVDVAHQW